MFLETVARRIGSTCATKRNLLVGRKRVNLPVCRFRTKEEIYLGAEYQRKSCHLGYTENIFERTSITQLF